MISFWIGFTAGALAAFLAAAIITWWSEREPVAQVDNDATEQ